MESRRKTDFLCPRPLPYPHARRHGCIRLGAIGRPASRRVYVHQRLIINLAWQLALWMYRSLAEMYPSIFAFLFNHLISWWNIFFWCEARRSSLQVIKDLSAYVRVLAAISMCIGGWRIKRKHVRQRTGKMRLGDGRFSGTGNSPHLSKDTIPLIWCTYLHWIICDWY
jgi:hypothetical protein